MSQFTKMKKQKPNMEELANKLKTTTDNDNDDRFWSYKSDEKGNYYGEIRFLPAPEGEDSPMVLLYKHFYKSEIGKWYINNCPTTLGGNDHPCPVCDANTAYLEPLGGWNDAGKEAQEFVRNRKRHMYYMANIYVVKDPANPENEGKVFLFKFGVKIHTKIMNAIKPQFEDETGIDPFNLWDGATFKLKVTKVDGQTTYDNCSFADPSPLLTDDEELMKVYTSEHSLVDIIAKDKFKDYKDLQKEFNRAEGNKLNTVEELPEEVVSKVEKRTASEPAMEEKADSSLDDEIASSEDETLAFFDELEEDVA